MRVSRALAAVICCTVLVRAAAEEPAAVSSEEASEIAVDAYIYAYPLVLMDVSRQVMTAAASDTGIGAPVNQFAHRQAFPDASFTSVVRPNADTLYSSLWFDVAREPLVIDVPDSGGRYYLLPLMDMWTDIFASPGKRTTGTTAQTFVIVGPKWQGDLPNGVRVYRAPTAQGWMIGRTQTNGAADYANVHQFQAGLKATPLSAWGKGAAGPTAEEKPAEDVPRLPPGEYVETLDAGAFFARFIALLDANPPHANDYPILDRMARIGLVPGRSFELDKAPPEVRVALQRAPAVALAKIKRYANNASPVRNGWAMMASPIGTYATDYLKRALIAMMGLGANVVEDAIYPSAMRQADGQPFDSSARYELHLTKDQIPPVRAFWSLTMYNDRQFFAANPIDRYAIGDRDKLKYNADGSLTIYIQRQSPGADKESNWLPAPAEGAFSMNLRLYWPRPEALDGTWTPPAVRRVE